MAQAVVPVAGSFRDPAGRVVLRGGRVFRAVNPVAAADFDVVRRTKFYDAAVSDGRVVEARVLGAGEAGEIAPGAAYVLEHPPLPFVSYPYEWPFLALKTAALLHLDLQIEALASDVMFSDASAYNVQFVGPVPLFIDTLSLRPYRPGELWAGHRQFCEQFLNPLLLRALVGVSHNAWYRGTQEGIATRDLRRLLPWHTKLSRRVATHVVLQDVLQGTVNGRRDVDASTLERAGLPRPALLKMLHGLRRWIDRLTPADRKKTTWQDYARSHSYSSDEAAAKRSFVEDFARTARVAHVWDIGCNTGDYAVAALEAGAAIAIGFDADHGALDLAFARARESGARFLPLFLDATNPSPAQGWAQAEREGLDARASADGVLALAVVHHLAITRNLPLAGIVRWLTGLAPRGVIEFVPKDDPMVQQLLALRPDIFPDYREDAFLAHVRTAARVERTARVSGAGRLLVEFSRDAGGSA